MYVAQARISAGTPTDGLLSFVVFFMSNCVSVCRTCRRYSLCISNTV